MNSGKVSAIDDENPKSMVFGGVSGGGVRHDRALRVPRPEIDLKWCSGACGALLRTSVRAPPAPRVRAGPPPAGGHHEGPDSLSTRNGPDFSPVPGRRTKILEKQFFQMCPMVRKFFRHFLGRENFWWKIFPASPAQDFLEWIPSCARAPKKCSFWYLENFRFRSSGIRGIRSHRISLLTSPFSRAHFWSQTRKMGPQIIFTTPPNRSDSLNSCFVATAE